MVPTRMVIFIDSQYIALVESTSSTIVHDRNRLPLAPRRPRARLAQRAPHDAQGAVGGERRVRALSRPARGRRRQHHRAAAAQGRARHGRAGGEPGARGARAAEMRRPPRPARRRQVDARREAGPGARRPVRRARSRGGEGSRRRLGEVFAMYGQDAFRRFERRALARVLSQHERAVIATSGSLVTDPGTYKLLLDRCTCVWLRASPEEHMARVIAQGDMRPFKGRSAALDEIKRLLDDRNRLYSRANATVDTSGKTLKQSLNELRQSLA